MAIKGKSKPRSRRVVTPGPRPSYSPVKKPLLARRGFRIGVLVVVVAASVGGILYGLARERTQAREQALAERERTAAVTFRGRVQGAIASAGQPAPPDGFTAFPSLTSDVDGLQKGTVKPRTVETDARAARTAAKGAWQAVDRIDVLSITENKGFDAAFVNYFFNAKEKMQDALKLYQHAALLVERAAAATGDERTELLVSAGGILEVAAELMNGGFSDFIQVQQEAGIFQPSLPSVPAGS
jgi:type II secretory pathway pseudopilin PulG